MGLGFFLGGVDIHFFLWYSLTLLMVFLQRLKQFVILLLVNVLAVGFSSPALLPAYAANNPTVTVTQVTSNTEDINVNFSSAVLTGDIVDIEIINSSNQKAAQFTDTSGGVSFKKSVGVLPDGKYFISVGLFTPNWASNYAWFDKVQSFTLPFSSSLTNTPTVTVSSVDSNTAKFTAVFSNTIPVGNIVDFELYDSSNAKVWQQFLNTGGSSFSAATKAMPAGSYTLKMGLFTANWSSNIYWNSNVLTVAFPLNGTVPSPVTTTSSSFLPNMSSQALSAYNAWKNTFVKPADGALRVVRPTDGNDTVSEGIGYGMLSAALANDRATFEGLWNYGKKYRDANGLMNWQINADGSVKGQGSATDADEDMAYALLKASRKWPGAGFETDAKNLINAMMKTEVTDKNLLNPGDNWGKVKTVNPSYFAPSYYKEFASFTADSRWNSVHGSTLTFLNNAKNNTTGLLPDWLNDDYSSADISFDSYKNDFYYDASRVPIRLLHTYLTENNAVASGILQKQAAFLKNTGIGNLKSGYTLDGRPLTNYLDNTFLSAYTAASVASNDQFSKDMLQKLVSDTQVGYFGSSLKTLVLLMISQQ